jgi:arylsulfatase A-like enzyme
MQRPNVLLIYTDQQRWDALGAAGNPHIRTPHLDRLAAQGLNCSHCFANHPLCQPSRASMLSGRYAESIGVRFNGIEMPEDIPCLWNILQPYGYHCAQIGK